MDNLRGFLGIKRMDKVLNTQIRKFCRVTKGMDERIHEGVLQWFHHLERIENDNFAKKFNVRECADICSMGSPQL